LQKEKVCTILQGLILVIQNYDSYWYRNLVGYVPPSLALSLMEGDAPVEMLEF